VRTADEVLSDLRPVRDALRSRRPLVGRHDQLRRSQGAGRLPGCTMLSWSGSGGSRRLCGGP
jgi:hypothetical protein